MQIYPITIPGGSDTQVQYNNGGIFGGVASATYNDSTGAITFQPAADSTTFLQVLDADGGDPIFNVDSTNERIGIGTASPSYALDVEGNIRAKASNHQIRIHDTDTATDAWTITTFGNANLAISLLGTSYPFFFSDAGELGIGETNPQWQFHMKGDDAIAGFERYNNNPQFGPGFVFRRGEGTTSSPSDIIAESTVGKIEFFGRLSGGYQRYGVLQYIATDTSQNGRFSFVDSDASTERFIVETDTGFVAIGSDRPETQLEIQGTTPYATLHNETHEDTDGGRESRLNFKGEQSGGEETTLARIEASHDGAADDEKGKVVISTNAGSDTDTPTNQLMIQSTGDWVINKTSGVGVKVDLAAPTFGWRDITGEITNAGGANKPTSTTYRGGIDQFLFSAGDESIIRYHIPHDYVPGTDIHLHVHWSHISAIVTGGTVTFTAESIYAKGHNQAAFSAPVTGTFVGTASTTQYQHIISETQYSASTPAGLQIDTDDLEPDGVILVRLEMTTNNITSSGAVPDVFIHEVDVHYQSTNLGTKQKAPDFYT
jgi:hypothetical protein